MPLESNTLFDCSPRHLLQHHLATIPYWTTSKWQNLCRINSRYITVNSATSTSEELLSFITTKTLVTSIFVQFAKRHFTANKLSTNTWRKTVHLIDTHVAVAQSHIHEKVIWMFTDQSVHKLLSSHVSCAMLHSWLLISFKSTPKAVLSEAGACWIQHVSNCWCDVTW